MNSKITARVMALCCLTPALVSVSSVVMAYPKTELQPVQSSAPTPTQERESIANQFVDLIATQQYDAAVGLLDPRLREEWTAPILQQRVEDFFSRTGNFVKRLDTKVDGDIVLVNTQFENVTNDIFVIFDEGGNQITGIDFPTQPTP